MTNLTIYNWWGESNEPPPYLKTKKQLAKIGMKPVKPVGIISTRKYNLYLYDPNNLESAVAKKKVTEAQLQVLAKGREKQSKERGINGGIETLALLLKIEMMRLGGQGKF